MAVEERLTEDEVVVVVLEALLDGVVLDLVVEVDVALFDQLVAVDAITLVDPQSYQLRRVLAALRRRKQHALHGTHYSNMDTSTARFFLSTNQEIPWEERLQKDLFCVVRDDKH